MKLYSNMGYTNNYKPHDKMQDNTQKNTTTSHKHGGVNTITNQSDSLVISDEAKAGNIPQLDRANAQHLWIEANGEKVSTFVTPDGIWMANNGGIGREAYEWIDASTGIPGMPKSTIQELEYMSKMLAHMPSGQLSVSPASYGRSIMAETGMKLSDMTGTYTVQELQKLKDKGYDLSKLPPKSSLMTAEQLQWLRGDDMMKNAESFQTKSLKENLQEIVNAFTAVLEQFGNSEQHFQATESAFRLLLGNNRGYLGNQLMQRNSADNASAKNLVILEQARMDSERQIDSFGNTFLNSFREQGAEKAFELAWSKL